ncbi:uncharacterized protein C2845_PM08G17760 [Panicum miliaceum]|uniref:LRAT domain-containing protein n=1 Tax=Panicum miliaceum TaxID=4540 RepID=A0A3L6R491_PANMI|nr:uncharacterized protein C2845_PM08G17760 [Panicum miliaceum]
MLVLWSYLTVKERWPYPCTDHAPGTFLNSFVLSSSSLAAATTCQRCGHLAQGSASDLGHVHRAHYLLDKGGFSAYSVFKNNCEDFAIYYKTGLVVETAFSVGHGGQLASLMAAFSTVALSPLRFLTISTGGLAFVTAGMYCVGRYVSDINIRRDVVKVPVQTLIAQATPTPTAMEVEVAAAGAVGASSLAC